MSSNYQITRCFAHLPWLKNLSISPRFRDAAALAAKAKKKEEEKAAAEKKWISWWWWAILIQNSEITLYNYRPLHNSTFYCCEPFVKHIQACHLQVKIKFFFCNKEFPRHKISIRSEIRKHTTRLQEAQRKIAD